MFISKKIQLNANTIYETTDYYLFVNTSANRDINNVWVNTLMEVIRAEGQRDPIKVVPTAGGRLHITDGGHRHLVCQKLQIPIRYMLDTKCDDTIDAIVTINKRKSLEDKDYVNGFVAKGNNNYMEYQKFRDHYEGEFKHGCIIAILTMDGGSGATSALFKSEKFKIGNIITSYRFADYLLEIKKTHPREYKTNKFVIALINLQYNPKFKPSTLLKNLAKPKFKNYFAGTYNIPKFKEQLIDVYNDYTDYADKIF